MPATDSAMHAESSDTARDDLAFFARLPAFSDFDAFSDPAHYRPLPAGWSLVIADICGSTAAIREGRYKEVNAVGVACIAAVVNAIKPVSLPFVFGGDGASFCVPPALLVSVKGVLRSCQIMAREAFALDLRVGVAAIDDLRREGADLQVARYQAAPHVQQAMWQGKAVTLAEQWIRKDAQRCLGENDPALEADYAGFECRWNEIRSPHGESIALLIMACAAEEETRQAMYAHVMRVIKNIYGTDDASHPIRESAMRLTASVRKLSVEGRIRSTPHRFTLKKLLFLWTMAAAGAWMMARKITTAATEWGGYKTRLKRNTDYRKFDDMLRMVLAGTPEQRHTLRNELQRLREAGALVFGLHAAPASIITCLVQDYQDQHLHFLDAANGGYAMAAVELKKQWAERAL